MQQAPAARSLAVESRAVSLREAYRSVWLASSSRRGSTGYTPDEASWEWLPWIAAEELCKVPRGVVYYTQVKPDTAQGYWNSLRDQLTDSGYPGTKHPAACKKPGALLNDKNKQTGQVQCWYFHTGLWASWYNQDTGVVGAASVDTTPQKIFDYLNRNQLQ